MSVMSALRPPSTSLNGLPAHRFSVKQYQRMVELGFLTDEDKVELLDGWIVDKMPRNPPHDGTISQALRRLARVLPEELVIRVQSAVVLPTSQPEPDLAIVRGPGEIYFERHPTPRDIEFLVEVSDSTLERDREMKGPLYAQARVAIYWIVNLSASVIEVYTQPRTGRAPGYRVRRDYTTNDSVPVVIAGEEIARIPVRQLVPPAAGDSE
jgi:hypothetical protein